MNNQIFNNGVDVLALQCVPGVFNRTIKKYYEKDTLRSPQNWLEYNLNNGTIPGKFYRDKKAWASENLEKAQAGGISWCTLWDKEYPKLLRPISDPPSILFYKGILPDMGSPAICVVGTRNPSEQSIYWTQKIIESFKGSNRQIISGMARGIDTTAHKVSLDNGLRTYAVFGCGVNYIYPKENKNFSQEIIAKGGGLISEFLPDTQPERFRFPQRNRILSALCEKTILIEAAGKSGALGTCKWAMEQGRELWVVSPVFNSERFAGNAKLINQGANLLSNVDELNDAEQMLFPKIKFSGELNINERKVLEKISAKGVHREELGNLFDFTPGQMELILFDLIEKGFIHEGKGSFLYPGMP